MDLCFALPKLVKFSSNPDKVHFEGLVHLLIYSRDIKNLGLKYNSKIDGAPIYDLLRQASIKTENQLTVFSDSIWHDCPDNVRSTGAFLTRMKVLSFHTCYRSSC